MPRCKRCHGTGIEADWVHLGGELRRRRVAAGLSLRRVARCAGISAAHLSDMERGRRSMGGTGGALVLEMFDLCVLHAYTQPLETWSPMDGLLAFLQCEDKEV